MAIEDMLVQIVVGLQHGSEGKGGIVSYLADGAEVVARAGAPNAGHTVVHNGESVVSYHVPSGWTSPYARLVIGRGAVIVPGLLLSEIEAIERRQPIKHRLLIDRSALVATRVHAEREQAGSLSRRIDSSSARAGFGISEALVDRVRREPLVRAGDLACLRPWCTDTVSFLNGCLEDNRPVVIEGTQGYGLSPDHGAYPYTTSRDTTAAAQLARLGITPFACLPEVIGVVRRYPIRVAGESGPFRFRELHWREVAARAGCPRDLTEYTSVTGLPRRIAEFHLGEVRDACRVNRVTELACTFLDHGDWSAHAQRTLTDRARSWLQQLEGELGLPVGLVKTGPATLLDYDMYRRRMLRRVA